ncbi:murein L,D-transpeptidase catalytic domain family protein [Litoribacter ruber]|uniref:murein L,D-transpeptidase catalytic domain family protein n=1 Tax=Litoribacter ruber TaxID=702568 RepID=UPI001BD9F4C2|nr:murein L,D-transpeptidase catalytic domain family protein [Litoribacter ruber]MBT0811214.1 murein L,D-transpeptidase catalytic domain family protein [Litoribacter ruber]
MIRALSILLVFTIAPIFSSNSYNSPILENDDLLDKSVPEEEILTNSILAHPENSEFTLPQGQVLDHAVSGYLKLLAEGSIEPGKVLTIVDFSLPSTEKRMWVIDVEDGRILHQTVVSHGRNSGDLMAETFSNVESSYMSSLGFYVTGETYHGKHGFSLRLDGMEKGFNDLARQRAIVIHGAAYANEDFITQTGRLGRSLGCPALPLDLSETVINQIKDKSCLFIYGNDDNYLNNSPLLSSKG